MAKDPAFSFYAQDYLVKSMRWTEGMKALYNDLRAEMWINGALQDDNGAPFGLTEKQRATFQLINKEFELTDSGWINPELEETRAKRQSFRQLQSDKGKKGGRPTKEKSPGLTPAFETETPGLTPVKPLENEKENEIELETEDEQLKGVQGENAKPLLPVPAMRLIWKQYKPKYIFREGIDEQPLRLIAEMIAKASNVNPYEFTGLNVVTDTWAAIVQFILTDPLYKDFQLTQVEKYFQAITQKMESKMNEDPKKQKEASKTSVIANNVQAAQSAQELIKKKYQNKQNATN